MKKKAMGLLLALVMLLSMLPTAALAAPGDYPGYPGHPGYPGYPGNYCHHPFKTEVDADPATCTEDGILAHYKCASCDQLFTGTEGWHGHMNYEKVDAEDLVDPKIGHDMEKTEADPADCSAAGNVEYYTCGNCEKFFADEEGEKELTEEELVDPIKPHTPEEVPADPATCTEDGLTAGSQCSACGEILEEQEIDPAKGHIYVAVDAKDATCTEDGNIACYQCSVCGKYFEKKFIWWGWHYYEWYEELTDEQVIIPATGHDMTETEADPATCTEDGNFKYYTCANCNKFFADEDGKNELTAEELVDPATGHNYVKVAPKAATCTEDGNIACYQCSNCGKYFEKKFIWWGWWYHEWYEELTDEQVIIPATGHDMTETVAVPSTCTEDGNIEYYTCGNCDKFFADEDGKNELTEAQLVDPADGHKLTKTVAKPSTCTEDGNIEYYTCSVCGKFFADEDGEKELTAEELVDPADGHKLTKTAAKAATYTKDGNKESYTCDVCKVIFGDAEGKKALTDAEIKDLVIPQLIFVIEDTAEISAGAVDKALSETEEGENVLMDLTHEYFVGEENVGAVAKIELPVAGLETLIKAEKALTLVKGAATVTLDTEALKAIVEQAEGATVTLYVKGIKVDALAEKQQAAIKDKLVAATISAVLICDECGKNIATKDGKGFGEGAATLSVAIPAELPEGVKAADLKVYFVDAEGAVSEVKSEVKDGNIVFAPTHFSEYVIAAEKPASPATGDNTNLALYGVLAIMAVLGMGIVLKKKAF